MARSAVDATWWLPAARGGSSDLVQETLLKRLQQETGGPP
jgi:hypothetical protein